jgi:hypothetical protein
MWATLFDELFAPLLVVALFATGRVGGNYEGALPPVVNDAKKATWPTKRSCNNMHVNPPSFLL